MKCVVVILCLSLHTIFVVLGHSPRILDHDDFLEPEVTTTAPQRTDQVIESFNVQTDIHFRFATTRMVSVVRNMAGVAKEMPFEVTLPKEAFIISFAMTIDGKVYDGEVKEKQAAKKQYDRAVERGQSAGHIKQSPRHSNRFEVSVNVANGTAVNFTLTYQEILTRKLGMYEYEMHVEPGQAVKDFNAEVFIQENRPLAFVKTPALRKGSVISNRIEASNDLTLIDLPTPKSAHIRYKPTVDQQGAGGLAARFVVQYDVEHADKGDLLVVDGFFLHLYSPKPTDFLPKDIIFVLDNSGSMSGQKITQLKQAMSAILKDLNEEDRFNILPFSSNVLKWQRHLVKATPLQIREAEKYVGNMKADGGTNINQALLTALDELQKREVKTRVGMVFFLTDGEATSGETSTTRIAANVLEKNTGGAAIFSLAFGTGANFESLKTISTQNSGFARKIYEASDAALQVESLYKEISIVSMKNVSVEYLPGVTKTTETVFPVVFNGTEVMICGLLPPMDIQPRFEARMSGLEKEGNIDVVLEIEDVEECVIDQDDSVNPFFSVPRDYTGIVEKMWAFLTIKQMLKEKQRVVKDESKVAALDKKILAMSLKYKFVTSLTSMVVTKPEVEGGNDGDVEEAGLEDVDEMSHAGIVPQRAFKSIRKYHSFPTGRRGYSGQGGPKVLAAKVPISAMSPGSHMVQHSLAWDPAFGQRTTTFRPPPAFTRTRNPARPTGIPKRKKGGKGKGKGKRKGKQAKFGILSAIVFRNNQTSLCLAPKKISEGNYVLIETDNDFKIEINTECLKRCRIVVPNQLVLTSGGKTSSVALRALNVWNYTMHHNADVSFVGKDTMLIEHDHVIVSIRRRHVKKKMLFSLEIVKNSQKKTSGMIDMLSNSRKPKARKVGKVRRQRKTPRSCQKEMVDASMLLFKKKANKFKV